VRRSRAYRLWGDQSGMQGARSGPCQIGTHPSQRGRSVQNKTMRDGIIIQERPCPRCTIRRTARLAYGTSFCFNCRLQWPTLGAPLLDAVEVSPPPHVFTADESARLSVYRAAVHDGFYTDWATLVSPSNRQISHESGWPTDEPVGRTPGHAGGSARVDLHVPEQIQGPWGLTFRAPDGPSSGQ
jgi:hypothetical protein